MSSHQDHSQRDQITAPAVAAAAASGHAAWLAAIPFAELERLVRLPKARLAAVFEDALVARKRAQHQDELQLHDVGGGWPWAACALVLPHLDKDDQLCAALTCRAFRDTLFALTKVEDTHSIVVKRAPRFSTAPRVLACSVGRLRWARGLINRGGAGPIWLARWDHGTCAVLAKYGGLAEIQWARSEGCGWDFRSRIRYCDAAAGTG